jgi:hypothetical protein
MYRSISGISSQALPRLKVCQGSAGVSLIMGVVGVTGIEFPIPGTDGSGANSTLLDSLVVSELSSGNTLVGLGAFCSHGKIGAGFWYEGVFGTSYHISFGGSGYLWGAWNGLGSFDIS